jgi:hypothetical protein
MRMIGLGLLGFLLAGVALLLSTLNITDRAQRYLREIAQGPQLVFEDREAVPATDIHTAVISRSGPAVPVILSSLPAYQSITFSLPKDARPTSGYLQIDTTSQVLAGVKGVLRISIRNTRRGEMLLHPGEVGRSLQIQLSPVDFAGDQLVVSFSLQGMAPDLQCGPDHSVAAVVEIETTSAVYVTLDQPLETVGDRVHAWGDMARVAWPGWLHPEEQARRLVIATQLAREGLTPVFVPTLSADGLNTVEMRSLLGTVRQRRREETVMAWPVEISAGSNAGLRRFREQTSWRQRFVPGGWLAKQLDLNMVLGPAGPDQDWMLAVTLNNRLVHHAQIAGTADGYNTTISLPAEMQSMNNLVEVALSTTREPKDLCDKGPTLLAELLPGTRITASDTPYFDTMAEMRAALSDTGLVNIATAPGMTAADADRTRRMLDQLLPDDVAIKPAKTRAQVLVLSAESAAVPLPDTGTVWELWQEGAAKDLSIRELPAETYQATGSLTVLVIPEAVDTTGLTL